MKTIYKTALLAFFSWVSLYSFARQTTPAPQAPVQQTNQVKKDKPAVPVKKEGSKKGNGTTNKIAVSDQAQPSDKNAKKTTKKTTGATQK